MGAEQPRDGKRLHDLAPCLVCDGSIDPDHCVDVRRDAATGRRGLVHMECSADGVLRAQRLGRNRVPARPGTWQKWDGEQGAQSLLGAFTDD